MVSAAAGAAAAAAVAAAVAAAAAYFVLNVDEAWPVAGVAAGRPDYGLAGEDGVDSRRGAEGVERLRRRRTGRRRRPQAFDTEEQQGEGCFGGALRVRSRAWRELTTPAMSWKWQAHLIAQRLARVFTEHNLPCSMGIRGLRLVK